MRRTVSPLKLNPRLPTSDVPWFSIIGLTKDAAAKANHCTFVTLAENSRRSTPSDCQRARALAYIVYRHSDTNSSNRSSPNSSRQLVWFPSKIQHMIGIAQTCFRTTSRPSRLTSGNQEALSVHHPSGNMGYHGTPY